MPVQDLWEADIGPEDSFFVQQMAEVPGRKPEQVSKQWAVSSQQQVVGRRQFLVGTREMAKFAGFPCIKIQDLNPLHYPTQLYRN